MSLIVCYNSCFKLHRVRHFAHYLLGSIPPKSTAIARAVDLSGLNNLGSNKTTF